MPEQQDTVKFEMRDQVAYVTLARPERRNAFDDTMIASMRQQFLALARDDSLRAVVLQGQGEHFSGGADLGWMQRMTDYDFDANVADAHVLAGMLQALHSIPAPTIAVVRGAAFGGAIGLIACCDMAIAADNATFALSEVKLGLIPATISPYVIAAIGARACSRLFLTGERFDAATAQSIGLISEAVPDAELASCSERLISELTTSGPNAVRAAKRLIRGVADQPIDRPLIDDTCQAIAEIRVSDEGQAGLKAFLGKTPPPWQNRSNTP